MVRSINGTVMRITKFSGLMKRGATWRRETPRLPSRAVAEIPGGLRASVLRRRAGKLEVLQVV
jgi:hypothetical protein